MGSGCWLWCMMALDPRRLAFLRRIRASSSASLRERGGRSKQTGRKGERAWGLEGSACRCEQTLAPPASGAVPGTACSAGGGRGESGVVVGWWGASLALPAGPRTPRPTSRGAWRAARGAVSRQAAARRARRSEPWRMGIDFAGPEAGEPFLSEAETDWEAVHCVYRRGARPAQPSWPWRALEAGGYPTIPRPGPPRPGSRTAAAASKLAWRCGATPLSCKAPNHAMVRASRRRSWTSSGRGDPPPTRPVAAHRPSRAPPSTAAAPGIACVAVGAPHAAENFPRGVGGRAAARSLRFL